MATAALRTVTQRPAGELLVPVAVVETSIGDLDDGIGFGEQLPATGKLSSAVAVGQEAVVANPLQPARKDMQQETPNEFLLLQAHHLLARVVAVILPAKADAAINEVDQTIVGNGHPMRVAAEIFEDLPRSAKWRLGVNHPLGLPHRKQIAGEGAGSLKRLKRVEEAELPGVKGALQARQKQSAKEPRQHPDRQEETRTTGDPVLAVGTQAASRDHTMQVRVAKA